MKNSYIDYNDKPKDWKGYTFKPSHRDDRPAVVYYFKDGVEQGFMRIHGGTKINTSTKGRKWGNEMLSKLEPRLL